MAGVCEPTPEEIGSINCLRTLMRWAGIPGNIHHPGSPAGALIALAGLKVPTPTEWAAGVAAGTYVTGQLPVVNYALLKAYANCNPTDWKIEVDTNWTMAKMGEAELQDLEATADFPNDPDFTGTRHIRPTITQRGAAMASLNAAKIVMGAIRSQTTERMVEQERIAASRPVALAPPTAATPNALTLSSGNVNLHQVIDEEITSIIPLMEDRKYGEMLREFVRVFKRPLKRIEEPSIAQMTALIAILTAMSCYVDLTRWGPYQGRTAKFWLAIGYNPGLTPGSYVHVELKGPPDYLHWRACWDVFIAAMVMACACSPAWLIAYADKIKEYVELYTDGSGWCPIWPFIYQCDVRFRKEHFPRMLRTSHWRLEKIIDRSDNGMGALVHDIDGDLEVEFQPDLPWEYLWSLPERDFWISELETRANHIIMRLKDPKAFLAGDVQVAASSSQHLATPQFSGAAARQFDTSPWQEPPAKVQKLLALANGDVKGKGKGKEGKDKKEAGKGRVVPENTEANRCTNYNNGKCKHSKSPDLICPVRNNLVHRCSKCGGPHSWIECPQVSKQAKAAIGYGPKDAGAWSKPWERDSKADNKKKKKWER